MPTDPIFWLEVALESMTLFVLLVGLAGLLVPVFPGLFVMWLATLIYALTQYSIGRMTAWDWVLFALVTILMIVGNVIDNIIIARHMREKEIPWSSIAVSFIAGVLASLLLTPIVGIIASPTGLFLAEAVRLKDRKAAAASTRAWMTGWGFSFLARFAIGIVMIGLWMLWAWI